MRNLIGLADPLHTNQGRIELDPRQSFPTKSHSVWRAGTTTQHLKGQHNNNHT